MRSKLYPYFVPDMPGSKGIEGASGTSTFIPLKESECLNTRNRLYAQEIGSRMHCQSWVRIYLGKRLVAAHSTLHAAGLASIR